ncbi:nucleoside phosphorylase [Campylobacter coli]|uniref:nucleoside phosphorylase n=1 Tax=Campylobacter coli TaxID=195 RepID=UPI003DA6AA46
MKKILAGLKLCVGVCIVNDILIKKGENLYKKCIACHGVNGDKIAPGSKGVTKIISVGSCGVLEDIPENRFLIPVSALRDEGTSYHYLPPSREVEISKAGINAIESALSQKNIPYWEVKTWTTDGFYRETVEMVQYRKEEGCQVVEMECSALAACAKFRKVTWAMLLFSADTLADPHKYQEREWGKTSISIALELALDAVLSVVEE